MYLLFLVTSAWNTASLKLRFPTNVGTERGQASFASCICFYILGACVYPYRDQDLVWKPVCHCGEQSKQCKLEEMSSILLMPDLRGTLAFSRSHCNVKPVYHWGELSNSYEIELVSRGFFCQPIVEAFSRRPHLHQSG